MIRVLVVDDDAVGRLLAEHILTQAGHEVVVVDGATEARTVLADPAQRIDVIVSDFMMPTENGLDLLSSLAADRPPFLLLTGIGEQDGLHDERVVDVDGFLTKPAQSAELVEAVERAASLPTRLTVSTRRQPRD